MLAAAGLILPAIIVLAVWANNLFDQRRAELQREALEAAREMIVLADAEAEANSRVLALLASTPAASDPTTERIERIAELALEANPSWNALVLRETASGRVLYETSRNPDARPLRPLPSQPDERLGNEGVFRDGRYCPCVAFHKPVIGVSERVITLFMSPVAYQGIMGREVTEGTIGGLVDAEGRFIARSLDFEARVGTPATPFVRRAAAAGGEGFYRGRTYEGLENISAYAASPVTGWSGHVALDRSAIDNPRNVANASVTIAVLAALILAAGLIFYAVNEARGRQLEEAGMIAMQKAEAISRFTSTVAHDSRNILAVIGSGIRLILRSTDDPKIVQYADAMNQAAERGSRLINQLLSFARGESAVVGRIELQALLEGCDQLLAGSLGSGIAYKWSVADDARHARGNADQIELALLNLAINARDAMDGKGTFTIEVTREGETVAVAACDDGPGVPPALRSRIFDAFYSTKGDGKGTGLGLAQVAGAARQAGGTVELKEAAGGGACFVIYLPAEEPPAE